MQKPKPHLSHWIAAWRFLWNPKTDWKPKAVLVVALLYLISPLDLIPDYFPLIGWLDDIGLLSFAAWLVFHQASSTEQ